MTSSSRQPSEVTETGSAVAGNVIGQALSVVTGDPYVGSAGGAVLARVLRRVGLAVEARFLGPRQDRRVAEALRSAGDAIREHVASGDEVRSDGFFDSQGEPGDAPGDELLEGVLRTAAEAWEQRKVRHIGRIFAAVSFDDKISRAQASYLLRLADRLTYHQIVLLAFWQAAQDSKRPFEQEVIDTAYLASEGSAHPPSPWIIAEMDELGALGLLGVATDEGVARAGATFGSAGGFAGVDLNRVRLTELGELLHRVMTLGEVPEEDLFEILRELRGA